MKSKICFPDEFVNKLSEMIQECLPEDIYKFDVSTKDITKLKQILGNLELDIELLGVTPYEKTLSVRKLLADSKWWEDRNQVEKIARWVVTDWGKVDRRAKNNVELNSLIDHANANHKGEAKFGMKRIPTWSKYIAFRYPEERAIYDARTAFSLNWLMYKCYGVDDEKRFFPFLLSENTLLSALDYRLWLTTKVLGSERILASIKNEIDTNVKKSRTVGNFLNKISIDDEHSYEVYCSLLKRIAIKIYPDDIWGLTKVEMILFSIASTEIARDVYKSVIVGIRE